MSFASQDAKTFNKMNASVCHVFWFVCGVNVFASLLVIVGAVYVQKEFYVVSMVSFSCVCVHIFHGRISQRSVQLFL